MWWTGSSSIGRQDPVYSDSDARTMKKDDGLGLKPEQIELLKASLAYYSKKLTDLVDHDIYCVSWDCRALQRPPDDLSAVLPPSCWDSPDLIVIGLQNVCPQSSALWTAAVDLSLRAYTGADYVAVMSRRSTSASVPVCEGGNMCLVYVRDDLLRYVSGVSVDVHPSTGRALAIRFTLHQVPFLFLSCSLYELEIPSELVEIAQADPRNQRQIQEVLASSPPVASLRQQQLQSILKRLNFRAQGRTFSVKDHAVIVFLGCKDNIGAAEVNKIRVDTGNVALIKRLRLLDLQVASSLRNGRKFKGEVEVLQAGLVRLFLELVDMDGSNLNTTVAPEVMLFRTALPVVSPERLRELYVRLWSALKKDQSSSRQLLSVDEPIKVMDAIKSFAPVQTSLKVISSAAQNVPTAFQVHVFSHQHGAIRPVSRHSFHHFQQSLNSDDVAHADLQNAKPQTPREIQSTTRILTTDFARKFTVLRKTTTASIRSAVDTFGKTITPRGGSSSPREVEDKGHLPQQDSTTSVEFQTQQQKTPDSNMGSRRSASELESSKKDIRNTVSSSPRPSIPALELSSIEGVRIQSEPHETATKTDLSRWIIVEPAEGVVLGGHSVTINVTLNVCQFLDASRSPEDIILVIRAPNGDIHCSISPQRYKPSFLGLSIDSLAQLPSNCTLAGSAYEGGRIECEGKVVLGTDPSSVLPLPKEIWWILRHIHLQLEDELDQLSTMETTEWETSASQRFDLSTFLQNVSIPLTKCENRTRREVHTCMNCIERGFVIPKSISVGCALRVLERWAECLPIPLIPQEFVADLSGDSSGEDFTHLLCRAVLLSLPPISRNVFICIIAVLREVLDHPWRRQMARLHALIQQKGADVELVSDDSLAERMDDLSEESRWLMQTGLIEWASYFLFHKSTPPKLAHHFLFHFLSPEPHFDDENVDCVTSENDQSPTSA